MYIPSKAVTRRKMVGDRRIFPKSFSIENGVIHWLTFNDMCGERENEGFGSERSDERTLAKLCS